MRVLLIMVLLCASVSASEINEAIGQLGAGKFADREAGIQQLVRLAEANAAAVLQECVRTYKETNDPEVKARLRTAMQQIVDKYLYRAPRGFLGIQMGNVGRDGALNLPGGIVVGPGGALVIQGGGLVLQGGAINVQGGGKVIINGVDVTSTSGVWVVATIPGSAAEKAGLQGNDCIVAIDGQASLQGSNFIHYVQSKRPGTAVELEVLRGAKTNRVEAVLGDLAQQTCTEQGGREFFKNWLHEQTGAKTNAVPAEKK